MYTDFVITTVASEDQSRPVRSSCPWVGYETGVDALTGKIRVFFGTVFASFYSWVSSPHSLSSPPNLPYPPHPLSRLCAFAPLHLCPSFVSCDADACCGRRTLLNDVAASLLQASQMAKSLSRLLAHHRHRRSQPHRRPLLATLKRVWITTLTLCLQRPPRMTQLSAVRTALGTPTARWLCCTAAPATSKMPQTLSPSTPAKGEW